jgi:glycine cleavage system protein P-like pyridoxal-binding family
MAIEKIKKLEEKIKSSPTLTPHHKEELLQLMSELQDELSGLEKTDASSAQDIAGKTGESTTKAISKPEKESVEESIDKLQNSVSEFEVSHPHLVQIINRICIMLSDIGI